MNRQASQYIWAGALLKLLPTVLVSLYLWSLYASNLSQIRVNLGMDMLVFSLGLIGAYFLYSYKARFTTTFLLLVLMILGGYHLASGLYMGEFDAFYNSVSFVIYAFIFLSAWLIGFGFARWSFFPWLAALIVFLLGAEFVVSNYVSYQEMIYLQVVEGLARQTQNQLTLAQSQFATLYLYLAPLLFYGVFILAANEILKKARGLDRRQIKLIVKRTAMTITALLIILVLPFFYFLFFDLPADLYERLNQAQGSSSDFLKKTIDQQTQKPRFDLNNYAQLLPEVKLSDETVFCTYIDNFFPTEDGGRIPLPVHFRRFVLNRYEPKTEKFVLDPYPPSAIPNDVFSPSIKDVPIGFSVQDSLVKWSTAQYRYRRNIAATVYNQSLDPNAYVAPNTGYFYQKLPVAPEDRATFTSVYQCSSLISIWNLPPFVYSTNQPELLEFREQRAQALREDIGYAFLDSTFTRYYTEADTSDSVIMNLARRLTKGKSTAYDKVEAVLDFFTGVDEDGAPRFTYTLKPGAPKTPGQSFMHYFLTENRKGYCTYFAGAMTLLLRAAGIPCRVAVGYAIFDRSNKNSGWYWVYADQGHAWVEVYFPSYGWVDFDPTPSDGTEPMRPPRPDATPPDYARDPIFAVLGGITGISSDSTEVLIRPYQIRYRNKAYKIPDSLARVIALKPRGGAVTINDEKVKIGEFPLKSRMVVSSYSFDYDLEKLPEYPGKPPFMAWAAKTFPAPIPVDEAIVVYQEEDNQSGKIFAVKGRFLELSADSQGVTVLPERIFYRNRFVDIEPGKAFPVTIVPQDSLVHRGDQALPLTALTGGDSVIVNAESGHPSLRQLKPYLATESFVSWFQHTFPAQIPVDKITIDQPESPFWQRFLVTLLTLLILTAVALALLGGLTYLYLLWRSRAAQPQSRLYWTYRLSLMLLNQLGVHRHGETPLEFARTQIDPRFGTDFTRFMNLYLRSKYAGKLPAGEESQLVERFRERFPAEVLQKYSRWQIVKSFANFIRTLRFLLLRS